MDLPKIDLQTDKVATEINNYYTNPVEFLMPDSLAKDKAASLATLTVDTLNKIEETWNQKGFNSKLLEDVEKVNPLIRQFFWDLERYTDSREKFKEIKDILIAEIEQEPFKFEEALKNHSGLYQAIRSSAIRNIRDSGSDFLGSKFDVNIIVTSKEGYNDFFRKFIQEAGLDIDFNSFGFLSRIEGITIPQLKANSFSLRTSSDLVQKVSSSITGNNKSSLKIRTDEMCYIYDMLNLVSNNNELTAKNDREIKKLSTFTTLRMADNLKHRTTIDIVVRNSCLEQNLQYKRFYHGIDDLGDLISHHSETELSQQDRCLWVFSDVNFLGFSNGPQFSHSSGDKQTLSVDFIYKRLVRIDPQKNYNTPKEKIDIFFEKFNKLEEKDFYYDAPPPDVLFDSKAEMKDIFDYEGVEPFIPNSVNFELTEPNSAEKTESDFSLLGTFSGLGANLDLSKVSDNSKAIQNMNDLLHADAEKVKKETKQYSLGFKFD